jgi:hypothetical protein
MRRELTGGELAEGELGGLYRSASAAEGLYG